MPQMVMYTDYKFIQVKTLSQIIGLCLRVLLELMSGLDGHHLYTDNYKTSPEMYLTLYKRHQLLWYSPGEQDGGFSKGSDQKAREWGIL